MVKMPNITGRIWFNTRPLTSSYLKNKVILADFWTYSCVNCLRTLPYLRSWWGKYRDKGFLLIGIHTPEFEFEKNPENVKKAVKDLKITWPVVLDNDYINWNSFANHYWPAKYMTDKNSNVVYTHFGEGSYEETELWIQQLLGLKEGLVEIKEHKHGAVCFIPTPELYCGYERGVISNLEEYKRDRVENYLPPMDFKEDSIALSGKFFTAPEYVEPREKDATIHLRFRGTEVNLVLSPNSGEGIAEVLFDNFPIEEQIRGKDLNDFNHLIVRKPKMFNLLKSHDLQQGVLSIRYEKGALKAYAFTFSGCQED